MSPLGLIQQIYNQFGSLAAYNHMFFIYFHVGKSMTYIMRNTYSEIEK